MGMPRPRGDYTGQMLDPGGWPEVDEEVLIHRADDFTRVLGRVTDVLTACLRQRSEVFDNGAWSGRAADAAQSELTSRIDFLATLQETLAGVVAWHRRVSATVGQTKSIIGDNVETAHRQITVLQNDPALDAAARRSAITTVVTATYGANVAVVTATAEQIRATRTWQPPRNALPDLLDRLPPPVEGPGNAGPVQPGTPLPGTGPTRDDEAHPVSAPPGAADADNAPDGDQPASDRGPSTIPAPLAGGALTAMPHSSAAGPVIPPVQRAVAPTTSLPRHAAPGADPSDRGDGDTPDGASWSPAASAPPPASGAAAGGHGQGVTPASVPTAAPAPSVRSEDPAQASSSAAAATPAAASPAPAGMMPAAATASAARGAGPGHGTKAGAPVPPTGHHPRSRSTAPAPHRARDESARGHEPPDALPTADSAAAAVIPVSAARAARDAVAAGSVTDSAHRPDPLRLARRIAAALNAPDGDIEGGIGFFWVTAVTTDGAIVVANSYGLAYIPDGVQLPDGVHMATADDAVGAAERARWATYPVLAVQGWAAHHDRSLRAVIATEEQFAASDPGAAKVVLAADDIPERGAMAGRPRLSIVDPGAAQRLADTEDSQLAALLPPAPVEATIPAEQGLLLWFDVVKPMASTVPGRETAHLRAFHTYVVHQRQAALVTAHGAADVATQRTAVADWLYWTYVADLLDSALGQSSPSP